MGLIYLIRHGRPAVSGVLLGASDVPLAGDAIAVSPIVVDRVLTSPLVRARRTAELLFPGMALTVVPEFAERGLGEWEGRRWDEVERVWPELARQAGEDWFAVTPPGGEDWAGFTARVAAGWARVPRSGSTAIVAHAGVNAVLRQLVDGRDPVSFTQNYLEAIPLAISD